MTTTCVSSHTQLLRCEASIAAAYCSLLQPVLDCLSRCSCYSLSLRHGFSLDVSLVHLHKYTLVLDA